MGSPEASLWAGYDALEKRHQKQPEVLTGMNIIRTFKVVQVIQVREL